MDKWQKLLLSVALASSLSACVTQQYGKDNTPVVENEASNDEIAMTRISLGLGYLNIGNTTQAKINLEKAKRYSPKLVQVHTAFAHYYETVGEPELASQSFQTALSIKSDDPDTLNNYGVFLCRQDDVEGAQTQFLKAIAVPEYVRVSESYENLALCHLNKNNFEQAEFYLTKALMHSPSSDSVLQQLAQLAYIKADYKSAQNYIARYEKATRQFSPSALALAYKVYRAQGNTQVAKNYGAMLVKMFPSSYEAKQYLLNELARIPADDLADIYAQQQNKSTKRVVVLSPKKQANDANSSEQDLNIASFSTEDNQVKPVSKSESEPENKQKSEPVATLDESSQARIEQLPSMRSVPVHVVKSGESVYGIARRYNLTMREVQKWNRLSSRSILKIGQVLVLADPNQADK
ncbi:type IV pilus biogenesis/stability protein PilW [Thalassotalea sp. LPB0316]|uniref:type IV pilus biogenesis/stability protein PilW n=1 Tax=Thalassotalea sp. LPB0316 TaxID=2769490 RepID=UPI0018690B15|nr:type IV pilus biogenesis/stability protein PilW [Thalassotalea sp. LPB0316]QOL26976.1 type IV pilus biogenesis/stability protein PilW [Thalassotalea sp. LPB0316]